MERLTNKREADAQQEEYERHLENGYPRNIPEERFLRLAAYEDTGLTPENVNEMQCDWVVLRAIIEECGGFDRVRELAEADKEGRVVVLPCKVGDTVRKNGLHLTPEGGAMERLTFDAETRKWFHGHPDAQTTVLQCPACCKYFKPSLGHRCKSRKKEG